MNSVGEEGRFCAEQLDSLDDCGRFRVPFVSGNTWRGFFPNGMEVRFYLDGNDKIISFYPVY